MHLRPSFAASAVLAVAALGGGLTFHPGTLLADGPAPSKVSTPGSAPIMKPRAKVTRPTISFLSQTQTTSAFALAAKALLGNITALPDYASAYVVSPANASVKDRAYMSAYNGSFFAFAPSDGGQTYFSFMDSNGDLNKNGVIVEAYHSENKMQLWDCTVIAAVPNVGMRSDTGGVYSYNVSSGAMGTAPRTQSLSGTVTAEDGHLVFAFRPVGQIADISFTRTSGNWELLGCAVTPQK